MYTASRWVSSHMQRGPRLSGSPFLSVQQEGGEQARRMHPTLTLWTLILPSNDPESIGQPTSVTSHRPLQREGQLPSGDTPAQGHSQASGRAGSNQGWPTPKSTSFLQRAPAVPAELRTPTCPVNHALTLVATRGAEENARGGGGSDAWPAMGGSQEEGSGTGWPPGVSGSLIALPGPHFPH